MQARYQAQLREEVLDISMSAQTFRTPTLRMFCNSYCIESTTNTLFRYSDSEDEDRPLSFNPPDCVQSPNLRSALETMRTANPDTLFDAVSKPGMEEIFPGRSEQGPGVHK